MAKQINQYTKVRTESTVQLADLLDFDSTDDVGVTYESARITVKEFRDYLRNSIPTLYSQDGSIGGNRIVDLGSNTLGLIDGNVGIGTSTPTAKLHVETSTSAGANNALLVSNNISDLLTVKDDGFVGIGTSTQSSSEILNINGRVKLSAIGANGTDASVGVALRTSLNSTAISFGTTGGAALYQQGGNVRLSSPAANSALKFELGLTKALDLQQGTAPNFNTELKLNHLGALVSDPIRNTDLQLISGYWDGAASQDKTASLLHNITSAPSGDSQLDFSIGGTDIVSMLDSGNVGIGTGTPSAKLEVKGSGSTSATTSLLVENSVGTDLFTVKDDGFVGVGTTDSTDAYGTVNMTVNGAFQVKNRITFLDVGLLGSGGGYAKFLSSTGSASQFGCIDISDEVAIVRGTKAVMTSTPSGTTFNAGIGTPATEEFQFYGTDNPLSKMQFIGGFTTTPSNSILETQFDLISRYWDGAASQDKTASVLHNITSAPSGDSQLEAIIGATQLMILKDTGVINMPNLPTSLTGLVAGDIWNNSGVLTIV